MPTHVQINVPGKPFGKQRERHARGTAHLHENDDLDDRWKHMRDHAIIEMNGRHVFDGPLSVAITAYISLPNRLSRKDTDKHLSGQVRPGHKPGIDVLLKMLDAFEGIIWEKPAQVVDCVITKYYGERPRILIDVWTFGVEQW